jgi:hypothetical protein
MSESAGSGTSRILNPEAVGDPDQTPIVEIGWPFGVPPCVDCGWGAQEMFNGRCVLYEACAYHEDAAIFVWLTHAMWWGRAAGVSDG